MPCAAQGSLEARGHHRRQSCEVESEAKGTQSGLTLQPHGLHTAHRILQARILEWVAFPFSRGSSQPRDQTQVSGTAGGFFYQLSYQESPVKLKILR